MQWKTFCFFFLLNSKFRNFFFVSFLSFCCCLFGKYINFLFTDFTFRNFLFSRASTNQLISHVFILFYYPMDISQDFAFKVVLFFWKCKKFVKILTKIIRRNLETASLTQLVSRITTFFPSFCVQKKIYVHKSTLTIPSSFALRVYILSRFWADAEAEERVAKAQ